MALAKLGRLDLLSQLYGQICLPTAVYQEVVVRGRRRRYPDARLVQLAIQRQQLSVVRVEPADLPPGIVALPLDAGEKEAIFLAQSEPDSLVLLDDGAAREAAKVRGLTVKGTLGVMVQAFRASLVTLDEVEALSETIIAHDQIWIAEGLCRQVLEQLQAESQRP